MKRDFFKISGCTGWALQPCRSISIHHARYKSFFKNHHEVDVFIAKQHKVSISRSIATFYFTETPNLNARRKLSIARTAGGLGTKLATDRLTSALAGQEKHYALGKLRSTMIFVRNSVSMPSFMTTNTCCLKDSNFQGLTALDEVHEQIFQKSIPIGDKDCNDSIKVLILY